MLDSIPFLGWLIRNLVRRKGRTSLSAGVSVNGDTRNQRERVDLESSWFGNDASKQPSEHTGNVYCTPAREVPAIVYQRLLVTVGARDLEFRSNQSSESTRSAAICHAQERNDSRLVTWSLAWRTHCT